MLVKLFEKIASSFSGRQKRRYTSDSDRQRLTHYSHLCALFDGLVANSQAASLPGAKSFEAARQEWHAFFYSEAQIEASELDARERAMETHLTLLLPHHHLSKQVLRYRQQYRELVGEEGYANFVNNLGQRTTGNVEEDLRGEAAYLLSELTRAETVRARAEEVRSYLLYVLSQSTKRLVLVAAIPIVLFAGDFALRNFVDRPAWFVSAIGAANPSSTPKTSAQPEPKSAPATDATSEEQPEQAGAGPRGDIPLDVSEAPVSKLIGVLALFSIAALAGALGAQVSASNRVQNLRKDRELARDSTIVRNSSAQIRAAPITGAIFSVVLMNVFAGNLVQGELFPDFQGGYLYTLHSTTSVGKLFVWCFIAGFSERFVPDILDRLTTRQNSTHSPENPLEPIGVDSKPSSPVPPGKTPL